MVLEKLGYVKKRDYDQLKRQIQEYKDKADNFENELTRLREELSGTIAGMMQFFGENALQAASQYNLQRVNTTQEERAERGNNDISIIPPEVRQELEYEMFSGTNPFAGLTLKALVYMALWGEREGKDKFRRDYLSGRLGSIDIGIGNIVTETQ